MWCPVVRHDSSYRRVPQIPQGSKTPFRNGWISGIRLISLLTSQPFDGKLFTQISKDSLASKTLADTGDVRLHRSELSDTRWPHSLFGRRAGRSL